MRSNWSTRLMLVKKSAIALKGSTRHDLPNAHVPAANHRSQLRQAMRSPGPLTVCGHNSYEKYASSSLEI